MAINKTINKSTKSHGAMRNCIEYVTRVDKTRGEMVEIIGPYEPDFISYDGVYQSFLEEKRIWGKDSGRMYAHNIISWHEDESITPEQALEFGKEFADIFSGIVESNSSVCGSYAFWDFICSGSGGESSE